MNVKIALKGVSPLLMHNPQMVDPNFEINREIKLLTAKKTKTDEDNRNIERLEWYGGIYLENGIVVQPTAKVRKCLINTARITKQGKQVERALIVNGLNVPLTYEGPTDIDALFADKRFTSRLSVGVSGKRVMRVRPQFYPWALEITALFVEDAGLNFNALQQIVELAGVVEGLGDNRVNGYGRFEGSIRRV